jgi:transposase-like protein
MMPRRQRGFNPDHVPGNPDVWMQSAKGSAAAADHKLPSMVSGPVAAQILDAVRAGLPLSQAADLVGIGRGTLWKWIRRGQREDADDEYRTFYLGIQQAVAEGRMELLRIVRKAADEGAWQAAMTLLERGDPLNFGRTDAIRINFGRLPDSELIERAAEIGFAVDAGTRTEGADRGTEATWLLPATEDDD